MRGGLYNPTRLYEIFGTNVVRVNVDLSLTAWNTVATHEVFTLTGLVRTVTIFRTTEDVLSPGGGSISFGDENSKTRYGPAQLLTGLDVDSFSFNGTPVTRLRTLQIMLTNAAGNSDMIYENEDIGYEITTAAATDGMIEAICFWTPLSANGLVVAGTGGLL